MITYENEMFRDNIIAHDLKVMQLNLVLGSDCGFWGNGCSPNELRIFWLGVLISAAL